eukprot:scaffold1558_cov403-Prasinococcus_capsulatus_cf.AAC.39
MRYPDMCPGAPMCNPHCRPTCWPPAMRGRHRQIRGAASSSHHEQLVTPEEGGTCHEDNRTTLR